MDLDLIEIENIDNAINHFKSSSAEDLYNFLKTDNDILKQIALLHLTTVSSQEEAELIVNTLINHPSETREYCSFLINRLFQNKEHKKFFYGETILTNIERAIFDVNPKVCRKIIDILPDFLQLEELFPNMIKNSFDLIELLQEKNKEKNYLYNKKSFHLYWHINALGYTLNKNFFDKYKKELFNLLEALLNFKEYTIREKGAYLALSIKQFCQDDSFMQIYQKFSNDENFYVKEILE